MVLTSLWRAMLVIALALMPAAAPGAESRSPQVPQAPQTPPTDPSPDTPDFQVQIWGDSVVDFNTRVQNYANLRARLQVGLPPIVVTDDPEQIHAAQRALANAIREARRGAKEGDLFTRPVATEFKRQLQLTMSADTWAVLMDDNPGEFRNVINGNYPSDKPFSTVPGNILARLPPLPTDIEYRFLGRTLILYDVRANVILDRIAQAIRCEDCQD